MKVDFQRALMSLSPENQERFYQERDAFFDETPFTHDLPDNFDHYRYFCGIHTNEIQLAVSADTFINMFFRKGIEQYSIGNISTICNASERVSYFNYLQTYPPKEGVNTVAEWDYMRRSFEVLTQQVNDIIEPEIMGIINKLIKIQTSIIQGQQGNAGEYKKNKSIKL
jgi:hypothetical protein